MYVVYEVGQKWRTLHWGIPQNLCLCSLAYCIFIIYVSKVILGTAGQYTNFTSHCWFPFPLPPAMTCLLLLQQQTSNFLSHYWGLQIVLELFSLYIISLASGQLPPFSFPPAFLQRPIAIKMEALTVWVWFSSQWQMFNNLPLPPLQIFAVLNRFSFFLLFFLYVKLLKLNTEDLCRLSNIGWKPAEITRVVFIRICRVLTTRK